MVSVLWRFYYSLIASFATYTCYMVHLMHGYTIFIVPYSGLFSNGGTFCIFRIVEHHTKIKKLLLLQYVQRNYLKLYKIIFKIRIFNWAVHTNICTNENYPLQQNSLIRIHEISGLMDIESSTKTLVYMYMYCGQKGS